SSTQITIEILSTDLGTDGLNYKGVKVTNVQPGGGNSNTVNLTVRLRTGSSASAAPASPAVVSTEAGNPTNIFESSVTTPAPVATPAVVFYVFKKALKPGMTNADIKKLQVFLNTQGFTVAVKGAGSPGKETNFFGPATKTAIMKFQKANKIKPVNGLLGPLTRARINAM
ncbi:MAG: peptidoglycan-binding domain-containing protein, partial [Candidatus Komeilibacteria bacterium]|nr:peptidoglycan-binding domain-containing protein [Candidatus Komeilibacteria bacterium]